jgi:nitroreductase
MANIDKPKETGCTPQEKISFLRGLRQVRQFRPDPLPQEVLNAVLEVARWSGSASNTQPWQFEVVRDRETLGKLAGFEGFAGYVKGAAVGIVLVMNTDDERNTYDEGRLSERMLLAATAYGVGASISWWREQGSEDVKALLGIPASRRVRTIVSLGYPDEEARRANPRPKQGRKPLSELVHEERYRA